MKEVKEQLIWTSSKNSNKEQWEYITWLFHMNNWDSYQGQ